ncbi:MAG: T9SS type A sorting domain-containing protein [Calditrichia bacterium]
MKRIYIFALVLVGFTYMPISATIINIPDDYLTIQEGIDASTDGDMVLVQPGTYVENINFNGHNIVLGSLFLTTGDLTYADSTVIDGGDYQESDTVIRLENGEDNTTVIEGFTIQDGWAEQGGGIYCLNSSPKITFNIIYGNTAITEQIGGQGGGIYIFGGGPSIINNLIIWNVAGDGAGIYCSDSDDTVILKNIIAAQRGNNDGTGIYCNNASPIIGENTFTNNETYHAGGGIYCDNSNPLITYNLIYQNSAYAPGSMFAYGGGIYCHFSNPRIINNTITQNAATNYENMPCFGGGIYVKDSNPVILNSIIWDNYAIFGSQILDTDGSAIINFSDVQDTLWPGDGNIDSDPLFVSPDFGNLYLSPGSPCIDAGDPESPFDPDGSRADMGALYYDHRVGIDDLPEILPRKYLLNQNYPNPFNASTTIQYSLPSASDVTIDIYDLLDRKVETLVQGEQKAGHHQVIWGAKDQSSGIYFYRIQAGDYAETKKMVLLK